MDYTLRHIRDLMNEAGIVWKTARPDYYEGDERDREAFKEGLKKLSELGDEYTVVVVDQTRKGVKTSLGYGWFKQGERNTIKVSGGWETAKLLGAVAETGESRYFRCSSNFNSEVTTHLLQALQREFGEKLVVVLDNAPYFASKAVNEFAEKTDIELCYLPRYSPLLNPVEECWRQFTLALKTVCSRTLTHSNN